MTANLLTRAVVTVVLTAACAHGVEDPIRVVRGREPGAARLTLVAAAGARINARLQPALELPDGSVRRFDSPAVTPDSSYYTAPPELLVPEGEPAEGVVRASVCRQGEAVCRLVTVKVGE